MILLFVVGIVLFWVAYHWMMFIYSLLKAIFVSIWLRFANENQVDDAYINHVLKKDPEYKKFKEKIKTSL